MKTLQHKFVETIPDEVKEGVVYISIQYCTAVHKCVCGCGNEVVTPISPTDWKLSFDGETITLYPSMGNWSFKCQSHYWIPNSRVEHARRWGFKEIANGRDQEMKEKKKFFRKRKKRE